MAHPETWLSPQPAGLYCAPGGFFIDPLRPVERAVITHAHSDHARPGHTAVLASAATLALMRARLGEAPGARNSPWPGASACASARSTFGLNPPATCSAAPRW